MQISGILKSGKYGTVVAVNSDGTVTVESGLGMQRKLKVINDKVYAFNPFYAYQKRGKEWRKSYPQISIPETDFFSTSTHTPQFDSMMLDPDYFLYEKDMTIDLKFMTPLEYLKTCAKGRFNRETRTIGVNLSQELRGAQESKIKRYAEAMRKGSKFPVPTIEYERRGTISQEGRHRALAVQRLIDEGYAPRNCKIPVLVVKNK